MENQTGNGSEEGSKMTCLVTGSNCQEKNCKVWYSDELRDVVASSFLGGEPPKMFKMPEKAAKEKEKSEEGKTKEVVANGGTNGGNVENGANLMGAKTVGATSVDLGKNPLPVGGGRGRGKLRKI